MRLVPAGSRRRSDSRSAAVMCACLAFWFALPTCTLNADDRQEEFFEQSIRPILADRCVQCHGEQEQSGGLRLDSREALIRGVEGEPVIDLDHPGKSRLLAAVRPGGELDMPPDDPLSQAQIDALVHWVESGAYWPTTDHTIRDARRQAAEDHWAFQPVGDPEVPQTTAPDWVRTPVDAFVLSRLTAAELAPSPQADRRTLIRRLSYTLTGLPPTPHEVEQFVADPDPDAWDTLVDRLLDSVHYGEHWARHWLDVARYSDTKGYVYAREERFWLHAWTYRDWVVSALNQDMPYDRFLRLQIAADQVEDARTSDLAAMGFLTLGRRFLGVERDIIDDRIDVVTRGTMGLTVGCARCHDHKYDPIPTADYYSLYGVFDSCREQIVRLSEQSPSAEFEAELTKRQSALDEALAAARQEWSDRVRSRVGDYLTAQTQLDRYPPKGFDQIFEKSDILPAFVRRWEEYLRHAEHRSDPVFVPWHRYADLPEESFADQAVAVTDHLQAEADGVNPLVLQRFATPPASFADVIERYAALFAEVDAQWRQLTESADPVPTRLDDPSAEEIRGVLYGDEAPCVVPNESIVHIESHMDTGTCVELWKLQGEVDRWLIQSPSHVPHAITLVDRATATRPRIFQRGNPATPGDDVPRQFLSLLTEAGAQPFVDGSGRRELADAIVDPDNPLTARVIVNRVWTHHFGEGLVSTPSDFGTRADPPSHPDLLDWLTREFVRQNWSLKHLHRLILKSATFRQSSLGPSDDQLVFRAQQQDPANRLLWRMNTRRLSFEQYRDSLLAVGTDLDRQVGGKPSDLFTSPYAKRRTLYGLVDRQFFPNTLRAFDFANPDLHIPKRPETTVPQQALFYLNHPFVLDRVKQLADIVASSTGDAAGTGDESQIDAAYRYALQRQPSNHQQAAAMQFLQQARTDDVVRELPTAGDWQYGYGGFDEDSALVRSFTPLPHYTGSAWQGGPQWPDAALGWVQLTATGGHPGNDREHAAIRRWTAPHRMSVEIHAVWNHEAAPGDGIRTIVISSKHGLLDSADIHQQSHEYRSGSREVDAGETIDFLVDIKDVLNSDQYTCDLTITQTGDSGQTLTWNSLQDFTRRSVDPLSPLEQLVHVLVSSNEFLFVD